ncbi:MAG: erythromycin esterase family protein [Deltaproteobacteria bacterium]|nr:erythromycin esterase family protein [Deltaproteobacteria bacterium]
MPGVHRILAVSIAVAALPGCLLDGAKDACETDDHCTEGRVCSVGLCVDPSTLVLPQPQAATADPVDADPKNVFALTTTDPAASAAELTPFLALTKNRQVVAFGDTYFTSGGMNELKARLVRALVTQQGYRAIALTTAWREAEAAGEYLERCTGDASAVLDHLSDIYQDVTVRNLLVWLCDFNKTHKVDPVRVFGFDIVQPWLDVDELEDFAASTPGIPPGLADRLAQCSSSTFKNEQDFLGSQELAKTLAGETPIQQTRYDACMQELQALKAVLDARGGESAFHARAAIESFRAWESYVYLRSNGKAAAAFDAWEQGNVALLDLYRLRSGEGTKTVIFAHAVSVARATGDIAGYKGAKSLGATLQRKLGDAYLPIAVMAYDMGTRLQGNERPERPTAAYAIERRFDERASDLDVPGLFVALDEEVTDATLLAPGTLYELGGLAMDPYRQFGAMCFLSKSAAMSFAR